MTLRAKVIAILIFVLPFSIAVQYAVQMFVVFPSFVSLEEIEAQQDLKRVSNAINREIEQLRVFCKDWASWDDAYDFIQEPTDEFIESNLVLDTFIANKLNLIQFIDSNNNTVWQKAIDLESEENIILDKIPEKSFPSNHILLPVKSKAIPLWEWELSGLIMVNEKPFLITSQPILTSSDEGPILGRLLMGRFLDQEIMESVKEQTQVDFNMLRMGDIPIQQSKKLIEKINKGIKYPIEEKTNDYLLIYKTIKDIYGKDILFINIKFFRKVTKQGFRTINYGIMLSFVAGIIICFFLFVLLGTFFLKQVSILTNHTRLIQETRDYTMRLNMQQKDEVGQLALAFDKMIECIELQNDKLEEANNTLEILSFEDQLTNLFNRRKFDEILESEWRRMRREKRPLSIVMCDVDYFKQYNDTYGHLAGDKCLQQLGSTIKRVLRRPTDFAGRYGGEEFVLLLANVNAKEAKTLAEIVRQEVAQLKIEHKNSKVAGYVTLSLGIASIIPSLESSGEELVAAADNALYLSKKNGRNRVTVSESMS